jgi:hypothetical protein
VFETASATVVSNVPSSLDKFLETSPAELVSDLKDVRSERAKLGTREGVIVQLLEMILEQGGPPAEELLRLAAEEGVAIGDLRDQIRQAMVAKAEENQFFLLPLVAHEALRARGNQTVTLDHVRMTMKRMVDAGQLLLPRPGLLLYALPDVVNNPIAVKALEIVASQEADGTTGKASPPLADGGKETKSRGDGAGARKSTGKAS